MAWTSVSRRLLSICCVIVCLFLGVGISIATSIAAIALSIAAFLSMPAPHDPRLTVQDRCLMNQDRLVAGATPGSGTMAIVMYFKTMPSVSAARATMRSVARRYPRFASIVVETNSLDEARWHRLGSDRELDLKRHIVEHGPSSSAAAQAAQVDELINTDLPRDVPLWRIDLLPTSDASGTGCVLLRASHALGDGFRLIGTAGDWLQFADGSPATLELIERMSKAKREVCPRGVVDLARDLVEAVSVDKVRDEDPTCLHSPGTLFPRHAARANVCASVRLADVLAIRAASPAGTTVNDVVVACLAGGLRRYAAVVGAPLYGAPLVRALCAVSLPRQPSRADDELYNDFFLPSIELPVGAASHAARLEAARRVMAHAKASRSGAIQSRLSWLLCRLGLDALIGQAQLGMFAKHAFVFSNLPGFTMPVHLFEARAKVERFAVYFPNLISQLFFLSYDGELTCCLSTDPATITQPQALVDCFAAEVAAEALEAARTRK